MGPVGIPRFQQVPKFRNNPEQVEKAIALYQRYYS